MWHIPACSSMALRSTGFRHSLHFTMPISSPSGSTPNTFMSRADSQDVGGDGGLSGCSCTGGEGGAMSHENGDAGGEGLGLSFKVIAVRR